MKTEAILSQLRKAKKKVDAERERLHRVIVALETLGSKAITAGKRKYKQSAKAKQRDQQGTEGALGEVPR